MCRAGPSESIKRDRADDTECDSDDHEDKRQRTEPTSSQVISRSNYRAWYPSSKPLTPTLRRYPLFSDFSLVGNIEGIPGSACRILVDTESDINVIARSFAMKVDMLYARVRLPEMEKFNGRDIGNHAWTADTLINQLQVTLRALRYLLWGVRIALKVDAIFIKNMIENPDSLPNSTLLRWVAYIKLFNITFIYNPATVHKAADGLSRREHADEDTDNSEEELEPDESGHFITGPLPGEMFELPIELDEPEASIVRKVKMSLITEEPSDIHITFNRNRQSEKHWIQKSVSEVSNGPYVRLYSALDKEAHQAMSSVVAESGGTLEKVDRKGNLSSEAQAELPKRTRIATHDTEAAWQNIREYLETNQVPKQIPNKKSFVQSAKRYFIYNDKLWRKSSESPKMVIISKSRREELLKQSHDESGHRGRDPTYRKLCDSYFWPNMYIDVGLYCRTCRECQLRSSYRPKVQVNPTYVPTVLRKFNLDVVHMGKKSDGFLYIVDMRDDLTGWMEARRLRSHTSQEIADFLWEDVICRFGCIPQITTDNGTEFQDAVRILAYQYGIPIIRISPYNPGANGMIERGHRTWINSIWKLCGKNKSHWSRWFYAALWADRVTTRRSTGFSPYHLLYGKPHVFPFDVEDATWYLVDWGAVKSTSDLIAARAKQIAMMKLDREAAAKQTKQTRRRAAEDYAVRNKRRLVSGEYTRKELVLVSVAAVRSQNRRTAVRTEPEPVGSVLSSVRFSYLGVWFGSVSRQGRIGWTVLRPSEPF